ncbi:MAG: cytochrome c biogenesis protein CcsA [Myxococcales bacterium]|nr:cytochrome c biogenesis protein CcsA [Myxococcales bacterium]
MEPSQTASSPVAVVGTIVLLLAFVVAAWSAGAGIVGNIRKDRRLVISSVYGLYGFTALAALASALIIYAFVTHDYSIRYVALTSDTSMPLWYKITAFWGGLDGSLLFWVLVLGLFSAIAVRMNYQQHRDMIGYVVATIMVVQLFFMALLVFSKNPFATYLTQVPIDGEGLNPLLQNYWMVIHPPTLYIGYVAATIPFAFAIAALASGRLDDAWIRSVRSWMLVCFFFLSLGLVLGGRWAYEELGWGGYWAWDPVENAGFIPWFTATAFLHSAIIQEQRGMLKGWNLILVIATFFLTIMGTFWTRSGVVQSVHAFGEDNTMALQFVLFMALILVVSLGLVIYRNPRLAAKHRLESYASREFAFLLNNWVLLACAAFVIFATMWPTLTEAYFGERTTVGIPFFNKGMAPLGIALLVLAGVAPLLAWRKTSRSRVFSLFATPVGATIVATLAMAIFVPYARHLTEYTFDLSAAHRRGLSFLPQQWVLGLPLVLLTIAAIVFTTASIFQEFWRGTRARSAKTGQDPFSSLLGLILGKRRKYGGYIVHLGIVVLFVGFIGKNYDTDKNFSINAPDAKPAVDGRAQGEAWFEMKGYRFHYEALREEFDARKKSTTARVSVWRDGKKLETLEPAQWNFFKGGQMTTEVAIHEQMSEDVYLVLTGFKGQLASFKVYINPLVNWVWIGFVLFAFGCFVCMIPQRIVDLATARPVTRTNKVVDAVAVVLTFLGVTLTCLQVGLAQPAAVREHDSQLTNAPAHMEGASDKFRPDAPEVPPAMRPVAADVMKQLVCMCGGCKRENIHDCKCSFAADERKKVLAILATQDVSTPAGRSQAITNVRAAFKREYGSEQVFVTPTSALPWMVPYVAIVVGLGLLFMVGRKWRTPPRSSTPVVAQADAADGDAAAAKRAKDEAMKQRLNDELEDLDG